MEQSTLNCAQIVTLSRCLRTINIEDVYEYTLNFLLSKQIKLITCIMWQAIHGCRKRVSLDT